MTQAPSPLELEDDRMDCSAEPPPDACSSSELNRLYSPVIRNAAINISSNLPK